MSKILLKRKKILIGNNITLYHTPLQFLRIRINICKIFIIKLNSNFSQITTLLI